MRSFVFASHNKHKLMEAEAILSPLGISLKSADEAGVPDIEETGTTFAENALLKARHAFRVTGLPSLADDSGLCVLALNDAPGLHSARFAALHGGYPAVFDELNRLLGQQADRRACFKCTMALVWGEGPAFEKIFEGRIDGTLAHKAQGFCGFGYDPLFVPEGADRTLALFSEDEKNKISHRFQALEKLVDFLSDSFEK